jgi:hypothetical protein
VSVRFTATGQTYTVTPTLGSQSSYSFSCWAKITTDRNDFSTFFSFDQNVTSSSYILQTDATGTQVILYDDAIGGNLASGPNMTVGSWYYFCVSVAGTTGRLYSKIATATSLTSASFTGAARTITRWLIGNDFYAEFLNGSVAATKFWAGVGLSADEADAESRQYLPGRTAGLQGFYPHLKAETVDYSGLAHTLTGGTGATTEDGPPIPWAAFSPQIIQTATAATVIHPLQTRLPQAVARASFY